jgi:hypothetical protein
MARDPPQRASDLGFLGSPYGIRTRAATLRGWCPGPLDERAKSVHASSARGRRHGRQLGSKESNPELQNQNLLCCQLHHSPRSVRTLPGRRRCETAANVALVTRKRTETARVRVTEAESCHWSIWAGIVSDVATIPAQITVRDRSRPDRERPGARGCRSRRDGRWRRPRPPSAPGRTTRRR